MGAQGHPSHAGRALTVERPKGRTPFPSGVQPPGVRPFGQSINAVVDRDPSGAIRQTAIATSASPPVWATTVRSAVPPGTSARSVQVPSAA